MHPIVEKFVDLAMEMEREARKSAYALKSYHRSKLISGEPTEGRGFEALIALRELDLRLLIALTNWAVNKLEERGISREEYDKLVCFFNEDKVIESTKIMYREERNRILIKFLQTETPDYLRSIITEGLQ